MGGLVLMLLLLVAPGGKWRGEAGAVTTAAGLYTGVSGGPWLDSKDPGRECCNCCGLGNIGGRA